MTNDPIAMTKSRFRRALLAEGAVSGLVWGGVCAALCVIGFRLLCHPAPGWWPWVASVLPPGGLVAGALVRLRRMPSRAAFAKAKKRAGKL